MSAAAAAPAPAKLKAALRVLAHLAGPRCSLRSFAPLQPAPGQGASCTRTKRNAKALPGRAVVSKAGYTSTVRPSKIISGAQRGSSTHPAALGTCSRCDERTWDLGKCRRGAQVPAGTVKPGGPSGSAPSSSSARGARHSQEVPPDPKSPGDAGNRQRRGTPCLPAPPDKTFHPASTNLFVAFKQKTEEF